MNAFLSDKSAGAYEKLVNKLLDDPRYGERWARHWLDLARYGETSGLEGDGAIGNVWRYRDWVIDAFNSNLPYDRFVILQIGGGDEHSKTRNNYQPDKLGPDSLPASCGWPPGTRSNLVAADVRQNYLERSNYSRCAVDESRNSRSRSAARNANRYLWMLRTEYFGPSLCENHHRARNLLR